MPRKKGPPVYQLKHAQVHVITILDGDDLPIADVLTDPENAVEVVAMIEAGLKAPRPRPVPAV
jgi:hypothetical protein